MADLQTLLSWSAAERQRVQASGTHFNGMFLQTDMESRGVLTAAYFLAKNNPNYKIPNWKIDDGVYTTLDSTTIIAAGDAVTAFVQRCFDKNAEIDQAIAAGAITTHEEIKAAFEGLN